ncbi:MAG: DNA-directed RNA polymerase subunit alpha [Planctomycetes bacterium]|nr:DNA-directed RNA polymerase subunit alpha [Planctomycetota bacterium]
MRIRWRNLELPSRVVVDRESLSSTFGNFTVEPFERGFGHTIGNALRRVLLSSIEGSAVRWFRLQGATHEFQAVDGVIEDLVDIVLQVKQIRVRIPGDNAVTLRIRKKGKGPVTAADIVCDGGAEIVNTDLHICTIAKPMDFEMDLEACRGRGYSTAEENEAGGGRHSDSGARKASREVEQEIGKVWVDSDFSPVKRVKYSIQDTRVGKLTDYDKLLVEVTTDGSLRPEEALAEASKVLRKFLNPLCSYGALGGDVAAVDHASADADSDADPIMLARPIAELGLSNRAANCLEAERVLTVGDLLRKTEDELLQVRNLGRTSLNEILAKLVSLGLNLAPGN